MRQLRNADLIRNRSVDEHIAFYLSISETCEDIQGMTSITELNMVKEALILDLSNPKHCPKWAKRHIRACTESRIKELQNLHSMIGMTA